MTGQGRPHYAPANSGTSETAAKRLARRHPVLAFLIVTFAISWSLVAARTASIVNGLGEQATLVAMILVAQFGPSIAAIVITWWLEGRKGIFYLLRAAADLRFLRSRLAMAIGTLPAFYAALVGLSVALGAPAPDLSPANLGKMGLLFLASILIGILFGGASEELGWRGYLLPRLHARFGFATTGVIIGGIWAVWHLDPDVVALAWTNGFTSFWSRELTLLRAFLPETIATSFFMSWFYIRSGGALSLMIALHATSNASVTALTLLWDDKPAIRTDVVTWSYIAVSILLVATNYCRKPI